MVVEAICVLGNGDVKGTIKFSQKGAGEPCEITGEVSNLKEGKHGFHIHQFGDHSGGCATTGGHFNPEGKSHGGPTDGERHAGDLGNIVAGDDGKACVKISDSLVSLTGVNSVIGRAVVVHADQDDLGKGGYGDSLTTGHAGARLACGVIGIVASK